MHQYNVDTGYATGVLLDLISKEDTSSAQPIVKANEQANMLSDADNRACVLYHSCRHPRRVHEAREFSKQFKEERETTWEEAMTYHNALDVSLRSISICIVDDEGTIQFGINQRGQCILISKYTDPFDLRGDSRPA